MTITVHTNPKNNARSAVTYTEVVLHVFPDGTFDIDFDDGVFRLIPATVTASMLKDLHRILFSADASDHHTRCNPNGAGVGMTAKQDDEFGPWQFHDGNGCPCVGQMVWIVIGEHNGSDPSQNDSPWNDGWAAISNDEAIGIAEDSVAWAGGDDDCYPVIRYRIRKPRELLDLIQLIADLPAPVKTDGVIA